MIIVIKWSSSSQWSPSQSNGFSINGRERSPSHSQACQLPPLHHLPPVPTLLSRQKYRFRKGWNTKTQDGEIQIENLNENNTSNCFNTATCSQVASSSEIQISTRKRVKYKNNSWEMQKLIKILPYLPFHPITGQMKGCEIGNVKLATTNTNKYCCSWSSAFYIQAVTMDCILVQRYSCHAANLG